MTRKVTQEDILKMNTLYIQPETHSYAAVARITGFSPSTVKKYIIDDFSIPTEKKVWEGELPQPGTFLININDLSNDERAEIEELRKEITI